MFILVGFDYVQAKPMGSVVSKYAIVLQGDAYTGNWLISAIRHTPKLARRMILGTMTLVAQLYPDKTHVL